MPKISDLGGCGGRGGVGKGVKDKGIERSFVICIKEASFVLGADLLVQGGGVHIGVERPLHTLLRRWEQPGTQGLLELSMFVAPYAVCTLPKFPSGVGWSFLMEPVKSTFRTSRGVLTNFEIGIEADTVGHGNVGDGDDL